MKSSARALPESVLRAMDPEVRKSITLGRGVPRESVVARAKLAPSTNVRGRGRSKLQAAYAEDLELRRRTGELLDVVEEGLSLQLAARTWYRPDFLLRFPDGHLEIHEVKGHWEDDARVKIKVAAEHHAWARFFAVTRGRGELDAGWQLEAIPGPRFVR